jgi:DNA (cytosine-5)-methyltransferase 1
MLKRLAEVNWAKTGSAITIDTSSTLTITRTRRCIAFCAFALWLSPQTPPVVRCVTIHGDSQVLPLTLHHYLSCHDGHRPRHASTDWLRSARKCAIVTTMPSSAGQSGRQDRPVAIDLFSGAGGLSLGFEQAGFDVVAAVEYDPVHAATHLFNFPRCTVLCRSVVGLAAEEVMAAARIGCKQHHPSREWRGDIDAIIGGPPCQGFSAGGKREQDDERNQLVLEFVRLVVELRPKAFCMENVAGLLESQFESVLMTALRRLRHAGYKLTGAEAPINAAEFGVPQRRKRVVILGSLPGCPAALVGQSLTPTAIEALSGLPPVSRYSALLDSDEMKLTPAAEQIRTRMTSAYARSLAGIDVVDNDFSQPRQWDPRRLTCSKRTTHSLQTMARFAATRPGEVEPKSRLYRLPINGPARTLRAGTGTERGSHTAPRPIHPTQDRVITVREAARLHGYPDWFRFHVTNWHGHRQVGNSVPPQLAKAAAESLLEALGCRPAALRASIALGHSSLLRVSTAEARELFDVVESDLPTPRQRKRPADGNLKLAE